MSDTLQTQRLEEIKERRRKIVGLAWTLKLVYRARWPGEAADAPREAVRYDVLGAGAFDIHCEDNANFIVSAPQYIDWLIEEFERVRAANNAASLLLAVVRERLDCLKNYGYVEPCEALETLETALNGAIAECASAGEGE